MAKITNQPFDSYLPLVDNLAAAIVAAVEWQNVLNQVTGKRRVASLRAKQLQQRYHELLDGVNLLSGVLPPCMAETISVLAALGEPDEQTLSPLYQSGLAVHANLYQSFANFYSLYDEVTDEKVMDALEFRLDSALAEAGDDALVFHSDLRDEYFRQLVNDSFAPWID
jgi:hypothetical protein